MIKNVTFKGLSTTPSAHESQDGELAAVMNLVPEDGALKPLHQPYKIGELEDGAQLWVHETPDYLHYIKKLSDGSWYWSSDINAEEWNSLDGIVGDACNDLAYNGNVLTIAMEDQPLQYVIWRATDNNYQYLGELPEVKMEFKLDSELRQITPKSLYIGYDGKEEDIKGETGSDIWHKDNYNLGDFTEEVYSSIIYNENGDSEITLTLNQIKTIIGYESGTMYFKIKNLNGLEHEDTTHDVKVSLVNGLVLEITPQCNRVFWTDGTHINCRGYATGTELTELTIKCDAEYSGMAIYTQDTSKDTIAGVRPIGYFPINTAASLASMVGTANLFTQRVSEGEGKFTQPFYVRYGLKLYDGTMLYLSSPELMIPNWGVSPAIVMTAFGGNAADEKARDTSIASSGTAFAFASDLYYKITDIGDLSRWKDVVREIVIGISAPISWVDGDTEFNESEYKMSCYDNTDKTKWVGYTLTGNSKSNLYDIVLAKRGSMSFGMALCYPPALTKKEYQKLLNNTTASYEILTIKQSEASTTDWNKIDTGGYNIMYPETGRKITTDTLNNGKLSVQKLKTYNGRMHLINVQEQLSTFGCALSQVLPNGGRQYQYRLKVQTKKSGKDYTLWSDKMDGNPMYALYFFSTDPEVYQLTVYVHGEKYTYSMVAYTEPESYKKAVIKVSEHEVLDGAYAYACDGFTWVDTTKDEMETEAGTAPTVSHANEIYVSAVDNPFVYPSANAVQCGRGAVVNVGVNTETISEGQFGEAPLYAFTTEETWVLSLADSGVYQTKQVLSNIICTNPDNIVALPSGVIFATNRGLMYASGKSVQCISDQLRDDVQKITLPHLGEIMAAKSLANKGDYLPDYTFDGDWLTFLRNCNIAYDKINDRIVVAPASGSVSFIYSMRSNLWGMQDISFASKIDKANRSWIVDDGVIYDLSNPTNPDDSENADNKKVYNGQYVVTRPMGIDDPDVMKRIRSMIARGYFRKGNVALGMYGSRDLFNWRLIHTSVDHYLRGMSGTPYKYLIAVLVSGLQGDESEQGLSFEYDNVLINQMR